MTECMYCAKDAELLRRMLPIGELGAGTVYLHRDQTHPGRCILALTTHVKRISELDRNSYTALMGDVRDVVAAITRIYRPDKVNVLILGDLSDHMHVHIVPKYRDGAQWGRMFTLDEENPVTLTEAEYGSGIAALRSALEAARQETESFHG